MGQIISILWEKPEFGHSHRSWVCPYRYGALDRFDHIAKTLDAQPLSKWVFEDAEILHEALEGCAEELEQADEIYPELEERSRFCQQQLETMRSIEVKLQELEHKEPWYEPKEAIATLNRFIPYLQEQYTGHPDGSHNDSYVIEVLTQLKQVLSAADKQRIRFAFDIS